MSVDVSLRVPRLSVAIVDDDAGVRRALHRLCEALGLRTTSYASGTEFIQALESGVGEPDCLLLDMQMAGMNGFEVQRHLASRGRSLPTVAITGDDAPETRARCVAAGIAGYLRKPVDDDELLAAVLRAVRPVVTRAWE